jgi:imidazolonepropionase-like amidohydrolase
MRKFILGASAVCSLALAAAGCDREQAQAPAAPHAQALVIQGGTLIDGTGGPPVSNSVIVIEGKRITAAGTASQVQVPQGAQIVNAAGKWIIPGLWDCQVNYSWFYGQLMLNQGVTGSCDIGNNEELGILHRNAVLAGKILSPRTWIGIGHLGGADPEELTGYETDLSTRQIPKSVEETRTVVRRLLDAGADQIMFHDGNNFTPEMVAAGCEEAHARNIPCTTRSGGPKITPREAALAGSDIIPHSQGIGAAVQRDGSTITGGDAERYSEMDDSKAMALIDILVREDVHPVPNIVHVFPGYAKDWARMNEAIAAALADPGLSTYYPDDFRTAVTRTRAATPPANAMGERRKRSYANMIRFHKMLIDAGGKPLIGGDTNGTKLSGFVVHDEMEIWQEGGIQPMQILQAATSWTAQAMKKDRDYGTIEAGKIADLVILNADPLQDIANTRQIDNVVFDGTIINRAFTADYHPTFLGTGDDIRAVEGLEDVRSLKIKGVSTDRNPATSPQPAIETVAPRWVKAGDPTTTITLTGFNFVDRSEVQFNGMSVPFARVSDTQLKVTVDAGLIAQPGRHDIVVVNPAPLVADATGTSNKAHLLVDYRY